MRYMLLATTLALALVGYARASDDGFSIDLPNISVGDDRDRTRSDYYRDRPSRWDRQTDYVTDDPYYRDRYSQDVDPLDPSRRRSPYDVDYSDYRRDRSDFRIGY